VDEARTPMRRSLLGKNVAFRCNVTLFTTPMEYRRYLARGRMESPANAIVGFAMALPCSDSWRKKMFRRIASILAIVALVAGAVSVVGTAAHAGGVSGGVLRNGK
jgi:hypothetical protein